MAVEKMKLLSITGKDSDLDNLLAGTLINCNIQIEDSKKIFDKGWKLEYYEYDYKIKEYLKKCENLIKEFKVDYKEENKKKIFKSIDDLDKELDEINISNSNLISLIKENEQKNEELLKFIEPIKRLGNLDVEARKLYDCKYLKFRYGNIPNENLEELISELENHEVVWFELEKTDEVTWLMYFTTAEFVGEIDGFFNMQKFERLKLPAEIEGRPYEYVIKCNLEILENEKLINSKKNELEELKFNNSKRLVEIFNELKTYEMINNLKKYISKDQNNNFYIVVWVPDSYMNEMKSILNSLPRIEFVVKDAKKNLQAPTKLKNLRIFRPFEMIVKMYGSPNVQEIDPTAFIAVVTCLMFGFMFGDVGQGAIILVAGIIMMLKKITAGAILVDGGIFSIIFGFLYGSVFGKEDILKPVIINPMENINTMLISGIAFGSVLIVIAMIMNIINGIKNKDLKKTFFEGNGLAGITMYLLVLGMVAYYFVKGTMLIPVNVIVCICVILILTILFNDKICAILKKSKEKVEFSFIEKIFEIIEMLLSFASNTISFLRLAAFAINHAGLCMAVYLLSDMVNGAGNLVVAILGNILVIVLEGLIVGIQVLRLEYYELFSRFYEGNGREYQSIDVQAKN